MQNLRTTVHFISVLRTNVALEGLYLDQFQKVNIIPNLNNCSIKNKIILNLTFN